MKEIRLHFLSCSSLADTVGTGQYIVNLIPRKYCQLMLLYSPVDVTGNLIMIGKLVFGET